MPRLVLAVMSTALLMLLPSSASARDYADTARNVVPSGQWGEAPVPPGADSQAKMYDSLTPKFDQVTAADLNTSFKSEGFGVGPDGPAKSERVPRRGVKIVRDRYHVPHITGRTRDDVTWAMGWVLQEDRGLLLAQARYAARLAAVDAPNINAFGLVTGLKTYKPTRQHRSHHPPQRPARAALRRPRRQGAASTTSTSSSTASTRGCARRRARPRSSRASTCSPSTRSAARSSARAAATRAGAASSTARCAARLGNSAAKTLFDDLSEHVGRRHADDAHAQGPLRAASRASAERQRDPRRRQPAADAHRGRERRRARTAWASNFLIVGRQRSTTGHPLFVGRTADRLLLPRPDARGRPASGPATRPAACTRPRTRGRS